MTLCYSDTETYCEIPIKHGTYRYAEGVEVMLWQYAFDDGEPKYWDIVGGWPMPDDLKAAIRDPEVTFVFHNSQFDRTVLREDRRLNIDLPVDRVLDTMVMALAHGLPGSLDKLCAILGVPFDLAKDKEGKALIRLFCQPQPANRKIRRATRETHPVEWERFTRYGLSDITAMREVFKRLPKWNYHDGELELWRLDQRINERGFAVDTRLAGCAVRAVTRAQSALATQTQDATYGLVESASKRDQLLKFILAAYGVELPDMQAATLERRLDDPELPEGVKELIRIRLQTSTSSTSKYKKLLECVSSDGRLRGTIQFCGASRTGRDAGRYFQPQNLPRPSMKAAEVDFGIEAIKADGADLLYDNVMELASNAIRGCIIAPPGKKLVVADLSNIEGRVAAWLAGEDWKLQAFRDYDAGTGHDLYAIAYAKAFNITPEEVMENKKSGNGIMRQIGKIMELMLQYEGGVGAFLTGAATYGIDLDALADVAWPNIPEAIKAEAAKSWEWATKKRQTYGLERKTFMVCDGLKRLWRLAHPAISSFWPELRSAAVNAVANPGVSWPARRLMFRRDGSWLRLRLPSNRVLCYPSPRLEDDALKYKGISQYTRQWGNQSTYGGKLFENATQAVARDVFKGTDMTAGANLPSTHHLIEQEGYQILLPVHDELITEAPDTSEFNAERLAGLMTSAPSWAEGLPLAAAGFEAYHYRKD